MQKVRKLLYFARLVLDLVRLAPGAAARVRMVRAAALLWPLRSLRRTPGPIRVTIRSHARDLDVFLDQADDLGTVREIFLDEAYRPPAEQPPTSIVDLGANIGLATRYFVGLEPAARVLAVEPDPRAAAVLRENVRGLDQVAVEPVAVTADGDGTVELFLGAQTIASSVVGPRDGAAGESVTVQTRRLDDLLDAHGFDEIDLLKIDVEGAEYDVLRSFSGLDRVRAIAGEFHPRPDGPTADEFFALLADFRLEIEDDGEHPTFVGVRERAVRA